MKKTTVIAVLAALCLLFVCCSCGTQGDNSSNNNNEEKELTPPEISELALENFAGKLQAGNYVVAAQNGMTTNAVSPDQVYIAYPHEGYPMIYAYMTYKGETFATLIEYNEIGDIEFVSTDNALNAVGEILPNNWITITEGNLIELF